MKKGRIIKAISSLIFIFLFSLVTFGQSVAQEVDLSIYAFDLIDYIKLGNRQNIEYQIFVFNDNKTTPATGVVVTAVLPPSLDFVTATTDMGRCVYSENVLTCNLGTVPYRPFDYRTFIRIYARPTQLGIIKLTARIIGNEPDPVGYNNISTVTTLVTELKSKKRFGMFY
jgi:uncharacterized repeat protein (TIGR01451 family)